MNQFSVSVNEFLIFRYYKILSNKIGVSKAEIDAKAKYDVVNRI